MYFMTPCKEPQYRFDGAEIWGKAQSATHHTSWGGLDKAKHAGPVTNCGSTLATIII